MKIIKNQCTAKNRAGEQCRKSAMTGKTKCRNHGGKSTGAPKQNKNCVKHGFYSQFFSEEEREALANTDKLKAVDDAIELIQVQLYRLAKRQVEQGDEPLLKEVTDRSGEMGFSEQKSERFDYEGKSALLTGRLAKLMKLRSELTQIEKEDLKFDQPYIIGDEQAPDEPIV